MRPRHAPKTQPEPAAVAAAWDAYDAATDALYGNAPSWPARQLWLNAIRRLRAVDPGFRHRPAK